jgi:hypothetical protein
LIITLFNYDVYDVPAVNGKVLSLFSHRNNTKTSLKTAKAPGGSKELLLLQQQLLGEKNHPVMTHVQRQRSEPHCRFPEQFSLHLFLKYVVGVVMSK